MSYFRKTTNSRIIKRLFERGIQIHRGNASAASVRKTESSIDCDEFDKCWFSDGISHSDLVGEDVPEGCLVRRKRGL